MRSIYGFLKVSAILIFFSFVCVAGAQEQPSQNEGDEEAFMVDNVSGEVTSVSKKYISIVYNRDYDTGTEYEIMIPIEDGTVLKHKRNISEIKPGDLVSIEYEKPVEGSKRKVKARTINFIQSGISELVTQADERGYSGPQQ